MKTLEDGQHPFDLGLLEHDLGNQCPISTSMAPPGKIPRGLRKPLGERSTKGGSIYRRVRTPRFRLPGMLDMAHA